MTESSEGNILIDNVNINSLGLHDLRHKLTILPQVSKLIEINMSRMATTKNYSLWGLSRF